MEAINPLSMKKALSALALMTACQTVEPDITCEAEAYERVQVDFLGIGEVVSHNRELLCVDDQGPHHFKKSSVCFGIKDDDSEYKKTFSPSEELCLGNLAPLRSNKGRVEGAYMVGLPEQYQFDVDAFPKTVKPADVYFSLIHCPEESPCRWIADQEGVISHPFKPSED